MKKNFCILISALIIISFSACRQHTPGKLSFASAVEYNDFLIRQQKNVFNAESDFTHASNDLDFSPASDSNLTAKFRILGKVAKMALDTVNKMEGYNGNMQFRDDAIKLFEYYTNTCKGEYKEMLQLFLKGDELTPEDQERMNQIDADINSKELMLNNAFLESQKKFATDNNIILN